MTVLLYGTCVLLMMLVACRSRVHACASGPKATSKTTQANAFELMLQI